MTEEVQIKCQQSSWQKSLTAAWQKNTFTTPRLLEMSHDIESTKTKISKADLNLERNITTQQNKKDAHYGP